MVVLENKNYSPKILYCLWQEGWGKFQNSGLQFHEIFKYEKFREIVAPFSKYFLAHCEYTYSGFGFNTSFD
jgi:hypothetical protein